MKRPNSVRAKLTIAATSLLLVCAFVAFRKMFSAHRPIETVVWAGSLILTPFIIFIGLYRAVQLHRLWGWGLTIAALGIVPMCIVEYRGAELGFALVAFVAALIGSYLLLVDKDVRNFRAETERRSIG